MKTFQRKGGFRPNLTTFQERIVALLEWGGAMKPPRLFPDVTVSPQYSQYLTFCQVTVNTELADTEPLLLGICGVGFLRASGHDILSANQYGTLLYVCSV